MIGFEGRIQVHYSELFEAKAKRSGRVKRSCLEAAEAAANEARSIAPIDSGNYAASITAEKTDTGARVVASDPISAIIEFGAPGRNLPARWILRTGATLAGLKFKKGGR